MGGLVDREMELLIERPELPAPVLVQGVEFFEQGLAFTQLARGNFFRRERCGFALEHETNPPQFEKLVDRENR